MALPVEHISQQLSGFTALKNLPADELQHIGELYPYYGGAQFFLAKKFLLSGKEAFENPAVQKAALHFPNELWLHFKLNESPENDTPLQIAAVESKHEIAVEKENINESNAVEDESEDVAEDENLLVANESLNEKLSSMLQQQAAEFEKPAEPAAELPVEVTPYHRVDYFDSQGIKLEEEKPNDKLGKQLKKFTQWLKQMKSINPSPVSLGNDEVAETFVRHIAENSNEKEEIVTEAMAEVLAKQGKPEQAIEIYQKLSFINPSKSVYFAAKIEDLKIK